MAVFYNKEKGKLGTLTGTIISFARELLTNDPKDQDNRDILPAGYLRCDGSILFADTYPILASVLGVGSSSRFKKPNVVLQDNQFQLPDLRSKHIRATTSSNIGLYNDLFVQDSSGNQIPKAGVALDVIQNIQSPFELTYNGSFYIPPQTVALRGEPAFSVDTGSYTYEVDVPASAFQPHLHRTTTTRTRQFDQGGNHFSPRQTNSVVAKSTLNVCQWWENTEQILCYWQITTASAKTSGSVGPGQNDVPTTIGPTNQVNQYGLCWFACANFTTQGYCLWPSTDSCPNVNNQTWNVREDNDGCNVGGGNNGQSTTFGNITYDPTWTVDCVCPSGLGCPNGIDTFNIDSDTLTNYGESPNIDINVPFSSTDDNYVTGYASVRNITIQSGEIGDEAIHRHRLNFTSDQPHTYQMRTRAASARADSGLLSQITVDRNKDPKSDKYIQPYIVTEYLIKI